MNPGSTKDTPECKPSGTDAVDELFTNPWEATDVADRQPQYCPYCGHSGAFDGQGHREVRGRTGYQCRCPDCGHQFVTLDPEVDG